MSRGRASGGGFLDGLNCGYDPNWIYARRAQDRRTCRHSRPNPDPAGIAATKDGRWLFPDRRQARRQPESDAPRGREILRELVAGANIELADNDVI